MADAAPPIDTRVEIVTPESIAFRYRVAGPFRRLPAYLLDLVIRIGAAFVIMMVVGLAMGIAGLGGVGGGVIFLLLFIFEWFYGALFETFWNGQTPGKRALGIRVLSAEGQPINGMQALARNILRSVDLMPLAPIVMGEEMALYWPTCLIGLTAALSSDRFQRLGDMASGTMVVIEEPQARHGLAAIDDREAIDLSAELPVNLVVSRSLARALSSYVERRRAFGMARRFEIAAPLAMALIRKYDLPPHTNPDHLLCAIYYRAFIADRPLEPTAVAAT